MNLEASVNDNLCSLSPQRITLRPLQTRDLPQLDTWAQAIDTRQFMSRCRPLTPSADKHAPERGLLWLVIQVDGADVGTVWLEKEASTPQAILGIFIGVESWFGRGIGSEAICQVLRVAQATKFCTAVRLNVRQSNSRAISCYRHCGFVVSHHGNKLMEDGSEMAYLTMCRQLWST
ncbi:MAG: GNAT family N-acetyltransferase [Ectopseudomonas guguanensis]|uniref:GNAT family N-acetyltransferase n=1 Tax=Ectopseudomonas guguanensis TaxID=1198456 RepID=UPI003919701C